eukprot:03337_6
MLYGWFAQSDERVPEVESWVCTYLLGGCAVGVFRCPGEPLFASEARVEWELGSLMHQFQSIIRISAMRTIPRYSAALISLS